MKRDKTCRVSGGLLIILLSISWQFVLAQTADSSKPISRFGGAVTATNNGISLLPTFSLGKPAVIFDMLAGGKRLTFEPQFRFAMEGKPWSFIFWWRYKLIKKEKFTMNVGAHPSFVFKTMTSTQNGASGDMIVAQRYLATELSPNYFITKNISVGLYYLQSRGLDEGTVKNTYFLTLNTNFSNLKLSKQFYMKFYPQVYYLKMDDKDGFYVTSSFTLARRNFPLSVQSIINKVIQTNILASKDFVWNLSLIYAFSNEFVRK